MTPKDIKLREEIDRIETIKDNSHISSIQASISTGISLLSWISNFKSFSD